MKKLLLFVSLLMTGSIFAVNYYVRTNADATSWSNITTDANNVLLTLSATDMLPSNVSGDSVFYLAPGTYKAGTLNVGNTPLKTATNAKIYGGFSGAESTIDLTARAVSDKDGNGLVEPWEFTNEAIITTGTDTYKFTAAGVSSGSRLITISGANAEVNGVTISDFNYLTYAGPITLGVPATTGTAANNVVGKEGILRLCTVKKIKSAIGIVMSTNKYSIIDRCLVESNVITGSNTGGSIYLNACGGKVSGCVVRNNAAVGTGGTGAGVYATSLASTNMDAIVENSIVYNNYTVANSGAIRGNVTANYRGIEIVNSTIVNNQTATSAVTANGSVELIGGGIIVNSIIVGDPSSELRANNTSNYVINTAYGAYATSASALYGSNNVSGKEVVDFSFTRPTTFAGVMIPEYTSPFDQTKYDAIRKANFTITANASVAVTTASAQTYPANYKIGGTGATITLSTYSIPTTDLFGNTRTSNIGAYSYLTSPVASAANGLESNGFIANWGAVSGATGYTVDVYTKPSGVVTPIAGSPFSVSGGATVSKFIPAALLDTYFYKVTALATNNAGNSLASNEISLVLDAVTQVNLKSVGKVYASNGYLVVENSYPFSVFNTQGVEIAKSKTGSDRVLLNSGVYLVKVNGKVQKVIVK